MIDRRACQVGRTAVALLKMLIIRNGEICNVINATVCRKSNNNMDAMQEVSPAFSLMMNTNEVLSPSTQILVRT
jgi:hypothetical protein